jgi:hypothetical protein
MKNARPTQLLAGTFFILHCWFWISAAEVDVSKLPPPASGPVEFVRDIQPIFEKSCLRCHGPEKPKSHFRLDNRESALQGGEQGVDIVPGQSARSPLIHNVARLVPDLEMPPEGKGDPLTPAQIGLLRAWIDQGANFPTNAAPAFQFSVSPTLRFITVHGDRTKFRELEGQREGWNGGLEQFEWKEKIGRDTKLVVDGHLLRDDYEIKLSLEQTDRGFIRAGFQQFRKYYDDTGGYYDALTSPKSFDLGRDLHLDAGRAWIDLGLTLPRLPRMVLGYEYVFRDGAKSTLEWGNVFGKNLYPAAKEINEGTHIIKFDLSHEFSGWSLEDNARVEFYDLKTERHNVNPANLLYPPQIFDNTRESAHHVQGMNAVHLEKQLTDWLFVSSGYLYSRLDGDAGLDQSTTDAAGGFANGKFWYSDSILLKREMHSASLGALVTPWSGLLLSGGVQSEWSRQEGLGQIHLDEGDPTVPPSFLRYPAMIDSNLEKTRLDENVSLRFTRIPYTVLFAEARLGQESLAQFERLTGSPTDDFTRDTDADSEVRDFKAGFNVSPWERVSLHASYRNRLSDTDYNHLPAYALAGPQGYSAFLLHRDIRSDEVEAKLSWKATRWLRTALSYRLVASDYETVTEPVVGFSPGGGLLAGNYDAQVYSLNAILTPLARLYLSTTLSYSDTRTVTAQNGHPSITPYRSDVYTALTTASYALNDATDLQVTYSFSLADYAKNTTPDAVPLGLDFVRHGILAGITRRWSEIFSTTLRYGFYHYDEPDSTGSNNFSAHGVFLTMTYKWK